MSRVSKNGMAKDLRLFIIMTRHYENLRIHIHLPPIKMKSLWEAAKTKKKSLPFRQADYEKPLTNPQRTEIHHLYEFKQTKFIQQQNW
jgi:uncharacterized phage-like protein YoqJ